MALSFPFGIKQLWDELSVMQARGLYWVNSDTQENARALCRQVAESQPQETDISLICSGERPRELLGALPGAAVKRLPLFTLPAEKAALRRLPVEAGRLIRKPGGLIIYYAPATLFLELGEAALTQWLQAMRSLMNKRGSTFLIICHSAGVNKIKSALISQHQLLFGFSALTTEVENNAYQVTWWAADKGVVTNQRFNLRTLPGGGFALQDDQPTGDFRGSDDTWYLAERSVLEGAPPLSSNWQLFDDNAQLARRGEALHAATLIFALHSNQAIPALAREIYQVRQAGGNGLKIAVREMKVSLRYTDEKLLQACGANLVVPQAATLSAFLTLLDGIQGSRYSRPLPENVERLITGMRPLQVRGVLARPAFCNTVRSLLDSSLLAEDTKGILLSMRPVPGLLPRQALSLCTLRRDGDLVTVDAHHLHLFLSNCRLPDLEIALESVFQLPVTDAFTSRREWHEDTAILEQLSRIERDAPDTDEAPLPLTAAASAQPAAPAPAPRRRPQPLTLPVLAAGPEGAP
ncbi:cellulose biosynthesis protein BcsE [Chimaeribacter coloradensis]|uniref:Cellulose biosynthesis protein BcsE n=1 Tax=Chimaeribacter coloradensis TaxID=2060068 RepID=A0A2N5E190_9GAMM|nr:cellulose biosynthesis protein BcsE [Chimaeribacter coloradensis]PLR34102.1 cellulose biosynthesis protein BcsE [Chimaeribacter coloradensis]